MNMLHKLEANVRDLLLDREELLALLVRKMDPIRFEFTPHQRTHSPVLLVKVSLHGRIFTQSAHHPIELW